GEDGKTEGQGETGEADSELGEGCRQDGAPAAAQHQPERSQELRSKLRSHRTLLGQLAIVCRSSCSRSAFQRWGDVSMFALAVSIVERVTFLPPASAGSRRTRSRGERLVRLRWSRVLPQAVVLVDRARGPRSRGC